MFIKSLALKDFRNYKEEIIEFNDSVNIVYGKNAQGKTNILEALYLCATSKSHRTSNIKELIRFEKDEAHIKVELYRESNLDNIDFHIKRNNKKYIAINKNPIKKLNELFGVMTIILFSPEDLGLIKNGPKERRRFLDLELCQINPLYYFYLKKYYHVLKQRNTLLKKISKFKDNDDELEIWDMQLIEYGNHIIKIREEFINALNPYFQEKHYKISKDTDNEIIYEKNTDADNFNYKLKDRIKYDIMTGSTSVGPHKDDLRFEINKTDIRKFGSQGQQRTAALALKLSEIEFIRDSGAEMPILLLDDVLSELDEERQRHLIESIKNIQTIITCTGIEDFINFNQLRDSSIIVNEKDIENNKLIQIDKGRWIR